MATLQNTHKFMNPGNFEIFKMYILCPTARCSFWTNISGHFIRFVCNHSNGNDFQQIGQIDLLNNIENMGPKFCITMK